MGPCTGLVLTPKGYWKTVRNTATRKRALGNEPLAKTSGSAEMFTLTRPPGRAILFSGVSIAAFVVFAASAQSALAQRANLAAELLVDASRDGIVDDADRSAKTEWTNERGAIILPNLGDKGKRCPRAADVSVSDAQLEQCNDAQDTVARAPDLLAPARVVGTSSASDTAWGQLQAEGAGSEQIRIFVKRGRRWDYLSPADRLTAREVQQGATLGIDARDVARDPARWNGRVTIRYIVSDGDVQANDKVVVRVAPVIIHNHLENAADIVSVTPGSTRAQPKFLADLDAALKKLSFDRPLINIPTRDNWAQDFVEFGYVSMPAPNGGVRSLRIALRSSQPGRSAGRLMFDLRGPGMGVVQLGGQGYHQVDSFGNLETIPPYSHDGQAYPAGRVIYGDAGDGIAPHQDWINFFAAQQVQAPVVLDTSWLAIGHVDEFVQFVPATNARGWTIAVKDVAAAFAIFRKAQRDGHGGSRAFSRDDAPMLTIDQLLADQTLRYQNELARRKIELNLEILKAATGVTDEEILRVPGLFHKSEFSDMVVKADGSHRPPPPLAVKSVMPPDVDFPRERIVYGPGTLIGYFPASVNGLFVSRTGYIAPRQWGPLIDGVDIMDAGVKAAYARNGINVLFVDDWNSHHQIGGEIHCGTNAIRQIGAPWWK